MKRFAPSLAALALTTPSWAQTFEGDAPGAQLGARFDVLGDVNGDGIFDLIAGFPDDDTRGTDAGRALVLSGADGSMLREHFGQTAGDRFGENVASAGRVDLDGTDDYMVAAPERGGQKGAVYVFSGASGTQMHFMRGLDPGDKLGSAIDRAGDVNGDGFGDVIVGAPGVDLAGSLDDGTTYVYSGADATLLHTFAPPVAPHDEAGFGTVVSWVGDVNGDGFDDVLAGTPQPDSNFLTIGQVGLFSGLDGAVLAAYSGFDGGHGDFDFWGAGIGGTGDITGDGVPDYMIGISRQAAGQELALINGATRARIRDFQYIADVDYVGNYVNVGDINADGVPDQAFLRPFEESIRVVSGDDGIQLMNVAILQGNVGFGSVIRAVDDVTGDGIRDLLVGIPRLDGPAGAEAGEIRLVPGDACAPLFNYCIGGLHSAGGRANMAFAGTASLAANDLVLATTECPPGKFGLYFYGPGRLFSAFGDGFRCVGAAGVGTFRLNPVVQTDANGAATLALDVTRPPLGAGSGRVTPGSTWYFQFWFRDPMGPGGSGFNLSDGLAVPFCP